MQTSKDAKRTRAEETQDMGYVKRPTVSIIEISEGDGRGNMREPKFKEIIYWKFPQTDKDIKSQV